jgi:hypothetical protein
MDKNSNMKALAAAAKARSEVDKSRDAMYRGAKKLGPPPRPKDNMPIDAPPFAAPRVKPKGLSPRITRKDLT